MGTDQYVTALTTPTTSHFTASGRRAGSSTPSVDSNESVGVTTSETSSDGGTGRPASEWSLRLGPEYLGGQPFPEVDCAGPLADAFDKLNCQVPRRFQREVLPSIQERRSVVVSQVHACSDMSVACVVAAMQLLDWNENVPQVLLLSPNRELAQYMFELVMKLGEAAGGGMHPCIPHPRPLPLTARSEVGTQAGLCLLAG